MRYRRIAAACWPALVLALASVWVVAPMFSVRWWGSHESVWYPVRVHEYLRAWDGGSWYPRWCPDFYGGYGYPFFNYYAPGVYFAAGTVAQVSGVGAISALKAVVVLLSALSAIGSYGFLHGETSRKDAALLGAACFVFLPYRCTDLFTRGDLAEYCAYCLLPWVAWAYRSIGTGRSRREVIAMCAAALLHSSVLLTHTLIGMFTTEAVGLYMVFLVVRGRRPQALACALCMGFALALSAVYVLPAFFERHLVHIDRLVGDRYVPWLNAVPPAALLDNPFFTPGWPFLIGAAVWLGSFLWSRTRSAAVRAAVPWAVAIALVVLMLPRVVAIWKIMPFGAQVQFPWRLLGFVGLFAALGVAMWWADAWPRSRVAFGAAVASSVALSLLLHAQRTPVPGPAVPLRDADITAAFASSTVMDEYLPRAVTTPPTAPRTRLAWSEDPSVEVRVQEVDGLHYALDVTTPSPTTVTLAVFGFRGWHVRTVVGPHEVHRRVAPRTGLLRLEVPQGGRYELVVHFGATRFRTAAALISLLALLGLIPAARAFARRSARG